MKKILTVLACLCCALSLSAQTDKKEVRKGNADFKRDNFKEAELDYRRALVQDSLSVAGAYNLANTLYAQHDYQGAKKVYDDLAPRIEGDKDASKFFYNKGNNDLQLKDYKAAMEDFRQSLLLNPGDISAKESYLYAKKMLENGQQGQEGEQGDHGDNGDQKQDDKSQNQQDQNQSDKDDNPADQQKPQAQPQPEQQISQQQAQQMLKAIQAKEKETQEKVEKAKAAQAKNRQKEKNW